MINPDPLFNSCLPCVSNFKVRVANESLSSVVGQMDLSHLLWAKGVFESLSLLSLNQSFVSQIYLIILYLIVNNRLLFCHVFSISLCLLEHVIEEDE